MGAASAKESTGFALRWTIGRKVGALAAVLIAFLCLGVAVSACALGRLEVLSSELEDISVAELPLARTMSRIALRQEEQLRVLAEAEADPGNAEEIAKATRRIRDHARLFHNDIGVIARLAVRRPTACASCHRTDVGERGSVALALEGLQAKQALFERDAYAFLRYTSLGKRKEAEAHLAVLRGQRQATMGVVSRVFDALDNHGRAGSDRARSFRRSIQYLIWIGAGVTLCVSLVLSWLVVRGLTRALAGVSEGTRAAVSRLAHGELPDAPVPVSTTDEIGLLASNFNSLMATLASGIGLRERAERRSARLAAAVEQATESVMITTPEGVIEYVNPAFERLSGYSSEEVKGRTVRMPKCEVQDEEFFRGVHAKIMRGEIWSGRLVNRSRDGRTYHQEGTISPLRDAAGEVTNLVGVMRDITAEVAVEEQLRNSQKLEALGQFAGGIAHDFNNLLTAIIGYGCILKQRVADDDCVDQILLAGERAAGLTRQLLTFSRHQKAAPRVMNLNTSVVAMAKMLRRLVPEQVELVTRLAEDLRNVRADPGQMEQVLMNLVVNARDAMPEGGKLTLGTANVDLDEGYSSMHGEVKPGPYVMVSVADTGCGMDEQTRSRIFEPFFTTKLHDRGTGLGLATVYGIVKQSGGHIWVYSEVGRGTTLKVYLPCVTDPVRSSRPRGRLVAPTRGAERILLAEDMEPVRDLAGRALRQCGYAVIEAADGQQALDLVRGREDEIDLVVTDIVMPGVGGVELASRLRKAAPSLRVLFISGYCESELDGEEEQFLEKPFTPAALTEKVREVLDAGLHATLPA